MYKEIQQKITILLEDNRKKVKEELNKLTPEEQSEILKNNPSFRKFLEIHKAD